MAIACLSIALSGQQRGIRTNGPLKPHGREAEFHANSFCILEASLVLRRGITITYLKMYFSKLDIEIMNI